MKRRFVLLSILTLVTSLFALPVGDPRIPDENRQRLDVPINQGVHEVSLHAFMGASKIDYPDMSGTQFSPGFGAGFSYSYFFLPKWSLLIGGGLQLFNNRGTDVNGALIQGVQQAHDIPDGGSDEIMLRYEFRGYEETQWSLMLMVPLMFQYQTNETRNKAFYYAMGVKLGLPFAGAYQGKVESAHICGYYVNIGACTENPDLGFGNFGKMSSYSKLKFGTTFFAASEAGVKWRLYNRLAVYTGFWMDWALNDISMPRETKEDFTWAPTRGNSEDRLTPKADLVFRSRTKGRAIPASMGFTVRFALGAGDRHAVPDSVRWIREIHSRDSLLALCNSRNKMLEDSLALAIQISEALLDSLVECHYGCQQEIQSREEMRRRADSAAAARIQAELAAAREKARLDSLARVAQLEKERVARLADFRLKLASIANGLDDYRVTQTTPSDQARERLDIAAELMRDYPDLKIRLTGHTCDKGTHEANVRFGMQRAESAKNYLISKGISQNRLEVASKAELEPLAPNTSEENRRKNRRVQIEILEGAEQLEEEAKQ